MLSTRKRTDLKILFAKSIYKLKGEAFCFSFVISQLGLNPKSYGLKGLSPFYMQKNKIKEVHSMNNVHEEDGHEGLNLLMVNDRIPAGAKLY